MDEEIDDDLLENDVKAEAGEVTEAAPAAAPAPAPAAPRHYGGGASSTTGRSLWFSGLTDGVADASLEERIAAVRTLRSCPGNFTVRRMQQANGAWVDFDVPALAQHMIIEMNGKPLGVGAASHTVLSVRYARHGETTDAPPRAAASLPGLPKLGSAVAPGAAAAAPRRRRGGRRRGWRRGRGGRGRRD